MDQRHPHEPAETAPRPMVLSRDRHTISRRNIDPDALKVLYRLHNHGFIAYLVGGAVRDLLLGRTPQDFDLVTDARPGRVKKLFGNSYLIGRRFRLVHVKFRMGKTVEVATFRKEPEPGAGPEAEDAAAPEAGGIPEAHDEEEAPACPADDTGRPHPADRDNTYGTPWEDAFRRDLTINALFYDIATFSIIDYVGGLQDLRRRLVRIIGDPGVRYTEDPVRIWRVLRHAARLDFGLEAETERAIATHSHLLTACSGFRLYEELNKDLESGTCRPLAERMRRHGVLGRILGRPGRFYEESDPAFAELTGLLDRLDRWVADDVPLSRPAVYSLLLRPWLAHAGGAEPGDKTQAFQTALADSEMTVFLPKLLRADIAQISAVLEQLFGALESGRFRSSLRRKPHYPEASRLCGLIGRGMIGEDRDPFETLFRERHPETSVPRGKRRRRPKRRPRPEPGGGDPAGG